MFRNLIFDWSGTLGNDIDLTIEATNYVLAQYGLAPLDKKQFRNEFQLPYPDYYAWKTPGAALEDLENYYRFAFDHSATPVTLIPHAMEFMEWCRAQGIRCFALTSMDPKAFDEQSSELGIKPFFEAIHSGIHNKELYIPTVMTQHGLKPEETAFIGDMQHDIRAAHCAGITGIGVLTGYNNAEQLAESEPELTVPHLGALRALLEKGMRAAAPAPQDSIHIAGLELRCHIGVPWEERQQPQRLTANIELTAPTPFATLNEDLARTIDYDALSRRLTELAESDRDTRLIETLADRLARCCVEEFGAPSATVEVVKYILPNTASCSVKTTRRRG